MEQGQNANPCLKKKNSIQRQSDQMQAVFKVKDPTTKLEIGRKYPCGNHTFTQPYRDPDVTWIGILIYIIREN